MCDKKSFVRGSIADEMAVTSRIGKLSICRRTVTFPADSFEVQEKLFGLYYAMDRCDGQSRFLDIDGKDCRAMTFDGASPIISSQSVGVGSRNHEISPSSPLTHCQK